MISRVAPLRLSNHATMAPAAPSEAIVGSTWSPGSVHNGLPESGHPAWAVMGIMIESTSMWTTVNVRIEDLWLRTGRVDMECLKGRTERGRSVTQDSSVSPTRKRWGLLPSVKVLDSKRDLTVRL